MKSSFDATEWRHIYETRLAILCEDRPPTPAQIATATEEANETCRFLKELVDEEKISCN